MRMIQAWVEICLACRQCQEITQVEVDKCFTKPVQIGQEELVRVAM